LKSPNANGNHMTYKVRCCPSCLRLELPGGDAQGCARDSCEGELVEIEVVPVSTVEGWRRDQALAEERIKRISVDLAGALSNGVREASGG
jgi:hypothetical protein